MDPAKARARRILVDAIGAKVLPQLRDRGFRELKLPKEPIPMWHFSRSRVGGGFDLISIDCDQKRRPLFDATINTVGAEGIRQPWGEFIEASHATAFAQQKQVRLLKKARKGAVAAVMRWLGYGWFGFRPSDSAETNRAAAERACEEFIACLGQAEKWWATGKMGPNLVAFDLGIEVDTAGCVRE